VESETTVDMGIMLSLSKHAAWSFIGVFLKYAGN
jgi:hypothetical protein